LAWEAPVHITVTDAFDLGQFAAEVFLKRTESEGGNRHGHRFVATAANDRSVHCADAHQLKMLRSMMSGCFVERRGEHQRDVNVRKAPLATRYQLRFTILRISAIDRFSPPRWIIEWQFGQTGTRSNSGDTIREERASEMGSR